MICSGKVPGAPSLNCGNSGGSEFAVLDIDGRQRLTRRDTLSFVGRVQNWGVGLPKRGSGPSEGQFRLRRFRKKKTVAGLQKSFLHSGSSHWLNIAPLTQVADSRPGIFFADHKSKSIFLDCSLGTKRCDRRDAAERPPPQQIESKSCHNFAEMREGNLPHSRFSMSLSISVRNLSADALSLVFRGDSMAQHEHSFSEQSRADAD